MNSENTLAEYKATESKGYTSLLPGFNNYLKIRPACIGSLCDSKEKRAGC